MLKDFFRNDPLEHKVYKPVNSSYPSCLVLFTSYFCGDAIFQQIYTGKNAKYFDFHCYFTKLNGFPHRMLYISKQPWQDYVYLVQINIVDNSVNFTLKVQFIDHEYMVISYNALVNSQLQSITSIIMRAAIAF